MNLFDNNSIWIDVILKSLTQGFHHKPCVMYGLLQLKTCSQGTPHFEHNQNVTKWLRHGKGKVNKYSCKIYMYFNHAFIFLK